MDSKLHRQHTSLHKRVERMTALGSDNEQPTSQTSAAEPTTAQTSSSKRKSSELEISFINFGMPGSMTALYVVDDPFAPDDAEDDYLLLVGTSTGDVYLSDILSKKSMGIVHRIPARGRNPLTHKTRSENDSLIDENSMQVYKQAGIIEMGSLSTTSIWIHFRGGMLGLYSWDLNETKYRLLLEKRFVLNCPGFCRASYDVLHERFVLPNRVPGGAAGFCTIDGHENKIVYDFSPHALRANCKRSADAEKLQSFTGEIVYVQPCNWNDAELYFIAFEDATVMLFDIHAGLVIEWFKRSFDDAVKEDSPSLMAIDSRPVKTIGGKPTRQFLISESTCVYLLYYDPVGENMHVTNWLKELKTGNHCTSVSFGPESFKREALLRNFPVRLAIGLNDGVLEVFSVLYEEALNTFVVNRIYTSLLYNNKEKRPSIIARLGWSDRWNMLFAGTDDGRVVHFERVRLPKSMTPR